MVLNPKIPLFSLPSNNNVLHLLNRIAVDFVIVVNKNIAIKLKCEKDVLRTLHQLKHKLQFQYIGFDGDGVPI